METRIWFLLFFSGFCFSQTPPNDARSGTILQGTDAPATTTASAPPRNTDPLGLLDNYQPQVTSSVLKFIAEIQTRSLENAITIQAQLNDLAYSRTPLIPDPRYFDPSRSRVKRQATSDDDALPEDLLRILGRDSVDQSTQQEPPRQPGTLNPPSGLPRPDPNNGPPSPGLFRQPGGFDLPTGLPRPGPIIRGQLPPSNFYPGSDPRYQRPSGETPILNQSPPPQYLRGPSQPLPYQAYPSAQNSGGDQTGDRNTGDNSRDQNTPINRTPTLIRIHPRLPASDNGQQNSAGTQSAPNGQRTPLGQQQPPRTGLTQGGIQRPPAFNRDQPRTPTLNGQPTAGRPRPPVFGNPTPTNFRGPAIPPAGSDGQRRPIPPSANRQPNLPPVNFRGPPFPQAAPGQQGRPETPTYNGQTNNRPVNFRGPSFQQRRSQPSTNNEQSNLPPINFRGPPGSGQQERPLTPTNNGQQNRPPINFIRPPVRSSGSGQQERPVPPQNNRVINTPVWRLPLYRYPNRGVINNSSSVPGPTYVPQVVNWSDPRNRPAAGNDYNRYTPPISPYTPSNPNLADWFDQFDRQLDRTEDQQRNQPPLYPNNNIGQPDGTYPTYNKNYPYNQNPNSRYPYSPEYGYSYPYNGANQQPRPTPYPGATPNQYRYPNNPYYRPSPDYGDNLLSGYNRGNVPTRQPFVNPGAGPTRPNTPYNLPPYPNPLQPSTPYIQRPGPNRLSPLGQTPSNPIRPFPPTLTRSGTLASPPNDQAGSPRIGQPPALRAVAGEEEHDEPYQNVLQNLNRYRNLIPTLRAVGQGTSGQQQQEPSYVKALAVLRSFIPGETFVYNGYIVQNFYIYGDYEMAKEHFRSLPNVNVTYSDTDKYSGYTGTIQNYRVTLCEACGLGQRYPVIEIVGLTKVYPGVVKRFLYSPSYDPMVDPMINPLNAPTGVVPTVPPV
ncbi:uncharacterized protein LOC126808522 [Patella vulgata]|uniref:uncharacterized protein LOC126808522 n=1 Tax=Patella vulgata TaxID=6465 RepID=UPI0024A971C6|nr:uncharacterized protein LOC126808522 [Patella vulgata]